MSFFYWNRPLWIIIFSFLGIYLIGKLKFTHDKETPSISVGRFFLAILTFSFTLYMVPGLLGVVAAETAVADLK